MTLRSVPAAITLKPANHERRQDAQAITTNQHGTSIVINTLLEVHGAAKYCRSIAKNAAARGSVAAGGGNQNTLEVTATIVSVTPHRFFLYAK